MLSIVLCQLSLGLRQHGSVGRKHSVGLPQRLGPVPSLRTARNLTDYRGWGSDRADLVAFRLMLILATLCLRYITQQGYQGCPYRRRQPKAPALERHLQARPNQHHNLDSVPTNVIG
jgi:hypothetical protein